VNFFKMNSNPWMQPFHGCAMGSMGGGHGCFQGGRALGGPLARSMMGYSAGGLWGGGWGRSQHGSSAYGQHGAFGHHGAYGRHGGHGACSTQREGGWDSSKGGYVVGKGGQLDVNIKGSESSNNNLIQYRVGNGEWKDVGYSKNDGGGTSIKAPPGSTVQFRINNGTDKLRAGTTKNVDGMDHGQVSSTKNGAMLSFEDQRGGGDRDFNDARIEIVNAKRRRH
jgi:hypothetical protein